MRYPAHAVSSTNSTKPLSFAVQKADVEGYTEARRWTFEYQLWRRRRRTDLRPKRTEALSVAPNASSSRLTYRHEDVRKILQLPDLCLNAPAQPRHPLISTQNQISHWFDLGPSRCDPIGRAFDDDQMSARVDSPTQPELVNVDAREPIA